MSQRFIAVFLTGTVYLVFASHAIVFECHLWVKTRGCDALLRIDVAAGLKQQ